MQDYLQGLGKELKGFPPEEQAALLEELRSHIESGEADSRLGSDAEQRRGRLMKELGSPEDMGRGFKALYRPNRVVDYLLVAIPYIGSLFFTQYYLTLRPQYPWVDIRLNVIFDLLLIAVGLGRRSTLLTLFWINIAVMQLLYIVLQGVWQPYWYFGRQTILWAALLIGLLVLMAQTLWKNRQDALILVYALLPLSMELVGIAVWSIQPVSHIYSPLDRSLLVIFLKIQDGNALLVASLVTTALFFLASHRDVRWLALVGSALVIGFGREYLFDYETGTVALVAQWVTYLYVLLPLAGVCTAWWADWDRRQQIRREAQLQ
jgi:hypothetical protein